VKCRHRLQERAARQPQGKVMELKQAIYTRRATREFTTEPVGEKLILDLIDAAVQAPSAVNQQPC